MPKENKPLNCLDPNTGALVNWYASMGDAAKAVNVSTAALSAFMKSWAGKDSKRKCGGYKWEWAAASNEEKQANALYNLTSVTYEDGTIVKTDCIEAFVEQFATEYPSVMNQPLSGEEYLRVTDTDIDAALIDTDDKWLTFGERIRKRVAMEKLNKQ